MKDGMTFINTVRNWGRYIIPMLNCCFGHGLVFRLRVTSLILVTFKTMGNGIVTLKMILHLNYSLSC